MHGSCARSHRRNPPYERHRHYDKVVAAAADAETTDRPIVPRAPMVYRVVVTAVYNHNCRPRLLLIKFFPLSSSFDRTVFFFQTFTLHKYRALFVIFLRTKFVFFTRIRKRHRILRKSLLLFFDIIILSCTVRRRVYRTKVHFVV